jgi:EAL domain-containing protein (putative c-di-GMP-specific phosphodiesterase class I)
VTSDRSALRGLIPLAAINGLICIVAPAAVVFDPARTEARVGHFIYIAAIVVLGLTPVQLTALWFVIRRPVREMFDRQRMDRRVEAVIDGRLLETAFQPIVHLASREVRGVEALARFPSDPTTPPDVWFDQAERIGRGVELELLAIRTHLLSASHLPDHLYIALNASPCAILSPELLPALLDAGIAPGRLVVEITEHASVGEYPPLLLARAELGRHGIRVAVDDAGTGYSTFRHIVELAPDIIKIDRSLIAGIDHDKACRAMVGSLVLYAVEAGSIIIGEGVETVDELDSLHLLGVDAIQGYLLGRPTSDPADHATWRRLRPPPVVRPDPLIVIPGPS